MPRDPGPGPALSVVAVTRDSLATLRPLVASLLEQTIAGSLELVIVGPELDPRDVPAEWIAAFAGVRCISVGPVASRGAAAAQGVRAARAAVVALTENHCFPDPDWAAATLQAHADTGAAAVGPAVLNANPESLLGWATYATGYGMYAAELAPGLREELPLHNSSLRAEVLRPYHNNLEHLLADERRLYARLVADGKPLLFAPALRKQHINEATWGLLVGLAFCGGWRHAAQRSRTWPMWRRLLYIALWPGITVPVLRRHLRILDALTAAPRRGFGLTVIAAVTALTHAAGECAGYLFRGREHFAFVENEEFLIVERLGGRPLTDPRLGSLVADLDRAPSPGRP